MSYPEDPQRTFLSFGSPFHMIKPKGSYLSPKLLGLLNAFEETMAGRLKKLKPADREDVLCLSWMRSAMESLRGIYDDIKILITALELPVRDWNDEWIDVYLDNSVKLLDICIAFSSEISRLKQGCLFLQCVLRNLDNDPSKQFARAHSSLDGWKQHIGLKNPRLDKCFSIMDSLAQTLDLPKVKNSSKGKVLMQAMYGVRVVTLFVFNVFAAAFSCSAKKLPELKVPETCMWAKAFADLQNFVNTEIRTQYSSRRDTKLKELEAVDSVVKKLYPIVQEVDTIEAEALQNSTSDLEASAEKFSHGLDLLAKEVDSFFQVVLTGRDALLCNLRVGDNITSQVRANLRVEGQMVR